MKPERKITVCVPTDLLGRAQKATGRGMSETVRKGLELVAAGHAYGSLLSSRGKVRFSIDLKELREDRR